MANKVMIVGTGNVGMSYGYALVNQRTAVNELVLVDINRDDAEGEAMDLKDALAVAPSFLKISSGTYADAGDCDIVVITAGVPQKPGESRMDLLKNNAGIFKDMVGQIMDAGFDGIFVVVSNPMDVMTYLTWRYSGLSAERVIGSGTVLDSARLRKRLAQRLHVHPKSVHAYQVGEHGDSELALWSIANVGGQSISELLTEAEMTEIEEFVRTEAYAIIEKKGATYYGIGTCLAMITNCILNDENRVLSVSNYDDMSNSYNGFPAIVGRHGVVRRIGLRLTPNEQVKLNRSIGIIKDAIRDVEGV
ncbi:MAG: L-lactate dehydrogenase [Candidatus Nomurabacteria bacterium]|jgi:L-lactate dehydrogenase|nr:L-lactate dehydrogenase [Candidatus Nomurabacteria bacterium]